MPKMRMWSLVTVILPLASVVTSESSDYDTHNEVDTEVESTLCEFPEEWRKEYFQGGLRKPFLVTSQTFGIEGSCYRRHEDNTYIIFNRPEKCYKCLKVIERSRNILEYILGQCHRYEAPGYDDLCNSIQQEEPYDYYTIVDLNGEKPDCPFYGNFEFTYKEKDKDCKNPASHLIKCLSPSNALLRFGVCPDSIQTEKEGHVFYQTHISLEGDPEETLTCIGSWINPSEPNEIYMIGTLDYRYRRTDEERVRCFLIKNETSRGISLAHSGTPSCYENYMSSSTGYRTMKLVREKEPFEGCYFPGWASDMGILYSFGFNTKYEFLDDGRVISVSNYSTISGKSYERSRSTCRNISEVIEGEYMKIVAQTLAGCETKFKCMRIFKRTENIIEIQEGFPTMMEDAACERVNFDEDLNMYTTLFKSDLEREPCPINGIHNLTEIYLGENVTEQCGPQGLSHVNIKCNVEDMMMFYQECPSEDGLTMIKGNTYSYICLGGWQSTVPAHQLANRWSYNIGHYPSFYYTRDNGLFTSDVQESPGDSVNVTLGYLVAALEKEPEKRICFMYMISNGTYSWTVDKTGCLRNIRPGTGKESGKKTFNTSVLETCGASDQVRWKLLLFILLCQIAAVRW